MNNIIQSPDWCHVGGINGKHYNYGQPHVTGYDYDLDIYYTNCIFCGKELREEI